MWRLIVCKGWKGTFQPYVTTLQNQSGALSGAFFCSIRYWPGLEAGNQTCWTNYLLWDSNSNSMFLSKERVSTLRPCNMSERGSLGQLPLRTSVCNDCGSHKPKCWYSFGLLKLHRNLKGLVIYHFLQLESCCPLKHLSGLWKLLNITSTLFCTFQLLIFVVYRNVCSQSKNLQSAVKFCTKLIFLAVP